MAIMLFFAFGTITSHAGTVQKPPKDVAMLPDLTIKLKLKTKKHTNSEGVICYSLQPIYTVTNNGMSSAKNFNVLLEWKFQNTTAEPWEMRGAPNCRSLGPGKSRTWGPESIDKIRWCIGDPGKTGFRVTADYQNKVAETKEDNNTATKFFPQFTIKKP